MGAKDKEQRTYVVYNVESPGHFTSFIWWCNSVELSMLLPKDPHVDVECGGKCNDFHVVTIRASLSHCLEIALKGGFNFDIGRCSCIQWC